MAEAKSDWKKLFPYWKKVLRRTFRETEIASVIKEAVVGGVIPPFLGLLAKVVAKDEVKELIFLAVSGAAALILIPFIFRVVFVTPEKMLRESEKKSPSSGQQPQSIRDTPKPAQPRVSGLIILGALCIGVVLILILQISRNSSLQEQVAQLKMQTNSIPQRTASKPLPDKTIPAPTNPAPVKVVASAPSPVTNAAIKEAKFETNEPVDGIDDIGNIIAAARAKTAEKEEKDRLAALTAYQTSWKSCLPDFRSAIQSLYDVLRDVATKRGDGITKTEGYFQCLESQSVGPDTRGMKLAEIRFQNQTNIDFKISLKNENEAKALVISTSCGTFEIYHWDGNKVYAVIDVPDVGIRDNTLLEQGKEHEVIDKEIKTLIAAQLDFVKNHNP